MNSALCYHITKTALVPPLLRLQLLHIAALSITQQQRLDEETIIASPKTMTNGKTTTPNNIHNQSFWASPTMRPIVVAEKMAVDRGLNIKPRGIINQAAAHPRHCRQDQHHFSMVRFQEAWVIRPPCRKRIA